MTKDKIYKSIQNYAYFIWVIFLILITVLVTYFYDNNKKNQIEFLIKSLNNTFVLEYLCG